MRCSGLRFIPITILNYGLINLKRGRQKQPPIISLRVFLDLPPDARLALLTLFRRSPIHPEPLVSELSHHQPPQPVSLPSPILPVVVRSVLPSENPSALVFPLLKLPIIDSRFGFIFSIPIVQSVLEVSFVDVPAGVLDRPVPVELVAAEIPLIGELVSSENTAGALPVLISAIECRIFSLLPALPMQLPLHKVPLYELGEVLDKQAFSMGQVILKCPKKGIAVVVVLSIAIALPIFVCASEYYGVPDAVVLAGGHACLMLLAQVVDECLDGIFEADEGGRVVLEIGLGGAVLALCSHAQQNCIDYAQQKIVSAQSTRGLQGRLRNFRHNLVNKPFVLSQFPCLEIACKAFSKSIQLT